MASLFGWEIQRKTDADEKFDPNNTKGQQFAPPASDDGALAVMDVGTHNTFLDVDGTISSEIQLLTRYREMSLQPEIAKAIDDIVNEVIAYDEKAPLVSLNMDNLKDEIPDRLRDGISNEFANILRLYDFNNSAYEIVRRWYIDGRMYYQALIDIKNPTAGIQELRYIDPRLIHKVRKIKRSPAKNGTQASVITKITEYYVYRDKAQAIKPMNTTTNYYQGTDSVKISKDAIIHATSGLMDPTNTTVLSYLHKANRPLNQLRAIENASVINRLVRAPMRRKFTVEMGALPKAKGEQYLRDQMTKYKNKLTYDSTTGTLKDNRHFMTMLEDFWFASRRGIKSVDVENLQGAGFHIIQSLLALGSGGLLGLGLGNSRQKFFYLPEQHTDFIFAILGEELGLIGAAAILALFGLLVVRGFRIAREAPDRYGSLVASGITLMIVLQAIINIGVTTGVLPITGVPLPFVSFGGSSLMFTLISVGILLNISQYGRADARPGGL